MDSTLSWQSEAIEMIRVVVFYALCRMRKVCALAAFLGFAVVSGAAVGNDMTIQSEPSNIAPATGTNDVPENPATALPTLPARPASTGASPRATKPQSPTKPLWVQLTPNQQQALAPLSGEWDNMDAQRKSKWLAIGNKFHSMKPDEQQRLQARMQDWVQLTPEQRRIARESYARAKTLNPNQKSEQWQRYQELPDDQKKKLAADAASKKPHIVTLPPASQSKSNLVQPIKSTPKPVLEQSVKPQAAPTLLPHQPPSTPATR
jgi:hypothetical protein